MMLISGICVILPFLSVSVAHLDKEFGGPFELAISQLAECEGAGSKPITLGSSRINRVNRTLRTYSTNITLKIPFTVDISGDIDIARWGNGGWRPSYLFEDFSSICEGLKTFYPAYFQYTNKFFGINDCPIPAGTYEIRNLVVKNEGNFQGISQLPYGKYRGTIRYIQNKTIVACHAVFFDCIPKRNKTKEIKKE